MSPRAFSMDCVWRFRDYLFFILANKGKSLTMEIETFVEKYFNDDESKLITKKAVSKQRQKFSHEIFRHLPSFALCIKWTELYIGFRTNIPRLC